MLKAVYKKIFTGTLFVLLGSFYFCDVFFKICLTNQTDFTINNLYGAAAIIAFGLFFVIKNLFIIWKIDLEKEVKGNE